MRTDYPEEGITKSQFRSCAELSFVDKVGGFIMATSPYHIASLLDKVRRVKVSFFAVTLACVSGHLRAGNCSLLSIDQ